MKHFRSDISGIEFPIGEKVQGTMLRKSLLDFIRSEHPVFSEQSSLSISELNNLRERYILKYISKQIGELSILEKTVIDSIAESTSLTNKLDEDAVKTYARPAYR